MMVGYFCRFCRLEVKPGEERLDKLGRALCPRCLYRVRVDHRKGSVLPSRGGL